MITFYVPLNRIQQYQQNGYFDFPGKFDFFFTEGLEYPTRSKTEQSAVYKEFLSSHFVVICPPSCWPNG